MKLNFKTLCACLTLVTYFGTALAEGGNGSSSYNDKGKQSEETRSKKNRTAEEWKTKAKKYKAAYKQGQEELEKVKIRLNQALKEIEELKKQINDLKQNSFSRSSSSSSLLSSSSSDSDEEFDFKQETNNNSNTKSDFKKKTAYHEMTDQEFNQWISAAVMGDIDVIRSFIDKGVNVDETKPGKGTALWYAAAKCNVDIIRLLIEKGANINYIWSNSVLTVFVESTHYDQWDDDILDLLLKKGADPNKYDKSSVSSCTPLMSIAKSFRGANPNRALKIIRKLLDYGAKINLEDFYGETALDYAETKRNKDIADFLKDNGAKHGSQKAYNSGSSSQQRFNDESGNRSNGWNSHSDSDDDSYSDSSQQSTFDFKQETNNNSNTKSDFKKKTAYHEMTDQEFNQWIHAAINGRIDVIRSFIDKGVNVDETKPGQGTALWYAAANCNVDIIRLLIEKGANINYIWDRSVLAAFVESTNYDQWDDDILDLLLKKGADPNKYDKSSVLSRTPLMGIATSFRGANPNRALKIIRKLLDYGAKINLEDFYGKTALDYAETNKNKDIADFLKDNGAKHGSQKAYNSGSSSQQRFNGESGNRSNGWNSHSDSSQQSTFDFKQETNNNSNTKSDFKKKTAYHEMTDEEFNQWTSAAVMGDIDVIRSFIDKGVNVNETRPEQHPALWYAAKNCHVDIIRLLIEKGADINYTQGQSVLTAFVDQAGRNRWDDDILDLLLKKGADPNKYDKSSVWSFTPLMSIAENFLRANPNRALKIIRKLLDYGAKINLEDFYGKTALDYAEIKGNKDIADFLKDNGAKHGSQKAYNSGSSSQQRFNGESGNRSNGWNSHSDSDDDSYSDSSQQSDSDDDSYEENTGSDSSQQSTRDEYIRQIEAMTSEECQQKVKDGIIDKEYFFYNSIEAKYSNNQAVRSIIEAVKNKGGKTALASKKQKDNATALRILVAQNSDLFKNVAFVRSIKQYLKVFHEDLAKSYAEASDKQDNRNQLKRDHAYLKFLIVDKI